MKLTKKKAIEKHRKMWDWLYKNPGKEKWEYPDLDEDLIHDCYLCTYAIPEKRYAGEYCIVKCPLKWPDGICSVDTIGSEGLFDKWYGLTSNLRYLDPSDSDNKKYLKKSIKILAKKIRDLPEK